MAQPARESLESGASARRWETLFSSYDHSIMQIHFDIVLCTEQGYQTSSEAFFCGTLDDNFFGEDAAQK